MRNTTDAITPLLKLRPLFNFLFLKALKSSIPFHLIDHQKRLKPTTKRSWENAVN